MSGLVTEHVLLVGGFGESPYLRDVLRQRFEGGRGRCKVMTANDATYATLQITEKPSTYLSSCSFIYEVRRPCLMGL